MGKFPFQFVYFKFITATVLAIVEFGSGQTNQTLVIGNDDPCAAELGVSSPSDNLSCEFVAPGGTFCYSRSELCNSDQICPTGSDEGANIAALDCEITMATMKNSELLVIVIDQLPRFVCSIEARIPRAKPEG